MRGGMVIASATDPGRSTDPARLQAELEVHHLVLAAEEREELADELVQVR